MQDDWNDIPPKKTAWGTEGEAGWWEIRLKGREDERVAVTLRGRLTKASHPVLGSTDDSRNTLISRPCWCSAMRLTCRMLKFKL